MFYAAPALRSHQVSSEETKLGMDVLTLQSMHEARSMEVS